MFSGGQRKGAFGTNVLGKTYWSLLSLCDMSVPFTLPKHLRNLDKASGKKLHKNKLFSFSAALLF